MVPTQALVTAVTAATSSVVTMLWFETGRRFLKV